MMKFKYEYLLFRSNLRTFWKYEGDEELFGIEIMKIIEAITPPVIIKTSLHKKNHPVKWVPVMTEMGFCRTFNSIFSA